MREPLANTLALAVARFTTSDQALAVQSVARGDAYSTKGGEELGKQLLSSMGRQTSASNAFHLCVQLGLMKHHENLYMREAGIRQVGQPPPHDVKL